MRSTPLLLGLLTSLAFGAAVAPPAAVAKPAKTVILGFDGADARLAEQWMNEGKLPNLAKLREQGTFAPLRSTIPSQTPVSWSTFATGLNPGRHGIFDFLRRNPDTYKPKLALVDDEQEEQVLWGKRTPTVLGLLVTLVIALVLFGLLRLVRLRPRWAATAGVLLGVLAGVGAGVAAQKWIPTERVKVANPRQGDTFWELLGKHGERVRIMRLPQNFPPKPWEHGEMLSGLGTPDLSLRVGKPFYFTSELFFQPRTGGEFSVEVVELVDNRGRIEAEIQGPPRDKLLGKGNEGFVKTPIVFTVPEDKKSLTIEVGGETITMKPGEWSNWVRFPFQANPLIKVMGIGRFRLLSVDPEVRLYLSPIQFDPSNLPPVFDITTPRKLAGHLADQYGLFKTIGWAVDTWSLDEGTIDEDVFLEDVKYTREHEEAMLYGSLKEAKEWDLLVHYFEYTDRVQHLMWRLFDPEHPLYDAEKAAKYGSSILQSYQDMDKIVGETMAKMPKDAKLIVVSDHGFAPFRWAMNYNTWLALNGFIHLNGQTADKQTLENLFDQGDFFVNVDWSKTKAYALGLGNIYINLAGREKQGIVQAGAEYEQVRQAIKAGLEAYVDEKTGLRPVAHVFTREEAQGVFDPRVMPDLIPSNSWGYRVGWQDTLGGIGKNVVEPNTQYWSADHCSVYPPLVNGILFSNQQLQVDRPYIADIFPTVLELYGIPVPGDLDGKSLLKK